MDNNYDYVEKTFNNGLKFEFGEVFEKTFENYKKIALMGGLATLVLMIVFTVITAFLAGIIYGFANISAEFINFSENLAKDGSLVIGFLISTVLLNAVIAPLYAGFLKMAYNAEKGDPVTFDVIFDYYKTSHFKELFVASLITTTIGSGIALSLKFAGINFVGTLVSYFFAFVFVFVSSLIIFGNLKALDAIKFSVKITLSRFVLLLAFLIVIVILACLGVIGLCIGIFFTLPIMASGVFCAYNSLIPILSENPLDEIGKVDNYKY